MRGITPDLLQQYQELDDAAHQIADALVVFLRELPDSDQELLNSRLATRAGPIMLRDVHRALLEAGIYDGLEDGEDDLLACQVMDNLVMTDAWQDLGYKSEAQYVRSFLD